MSVRVPCTVERRELPVEDHQKVGLSGPTWTTGLDLRSPVTDTKNSTLA